MESKVGKRWARGGTKAKRWNQKGTKGNEGCKVEPKVKGGIKGGNKVEPRIKNGTKGVAKAGGSRSPCWHREASAEPVAEQLRSATGREVGLSLEKEFGSLKPWSVGDGVEH